MLQSSGLPRSGNGRHREIEMWNRLSTDGPVDETQVGGKAGSLIRLIRAGFRVPGGVVLTTAFFAGWIEQIVSSETWHAVVERAGDPDGAAFRLACSELGKSAANLVSSPAQREALAAATAELGPGPFAVRSSSPEEDLEGASFAGLYETVLSVGCDEFERAVRTCFESCLAPRVLLYKREMDLASLSPSIAVVIQEQIASETSGVAFSLNPLTNDYDELLINASWGLGEALVSG
ncbi:MAG: PEP/pyruvate-binding domain-containing protein, partial [Myxococcota bacterium]